jgi:Protein of unknown function (DUF3048) N-terminal domain/Protein of unknown function (DUF3048) C-terminal domain
VINRWTKFLTATVATASLLLLTSCGSSSTSATKYPKVVSTNALTGLPGINGPVLFVKIDDTRQAHPQIGLDSADVIYIEQVEGGLTRLAAIFSNTLPAKIGPIRSARISDIDLMANYGRVGMAYSGAQSKFLPVLRASNIEDIGADTEPASIYSRDPSRSAPTDMVVDPKALLNKSINVEHRSIVTAKSVGWKFGPLPVGGQVIKSVELKWPAARYKAVWSSGTQKWQMYYNGALDVAADGAQLGSPTLLIQEVSITPSIYHDKLGSYTPFSNTIGSGSGFLLRDGQEIPVFWNRVNATEPTTWTLKDGSPAYLPVGQVWIALTDQQPVFVLPALSTPTPSASK